MVCDEDDKLVVVGTVLLLVVFGVVLPLELVLLLEAVLLVVVVLLLDAVPPPATSLLMPVDARGIVQACPQGLPSGDQSLLAVGGRCGGTGYEDNLGGHLEFVAPTIGAHARWQHVMPLHA